LQIVLIMAIMALNMRLWNLFLGSPFFTLEYRPPSPLNHTPGIYALAGMIGFFESTLLVSMPLLLLVTKWLVVGKWRKTDPSEYFGMQTLTCRQYFAFMGAPVWYGGRQLWQPRFYGTRFQNLWYRAMGSKVGRGVLIFSNGVEDYDALTIEDDVAVGHGCFVIGHIFEGKGLAFGEITLGAGTTVLTDRQVWPGAVTAAGAVVSGTGPPIRNYHSGIRLDTCRI
jgi:hypothetical protein